METTRTIARVRDQYGSIIREVRFTTDNSNPAASHFDFVPKDVRSPQQPRTVELLRGNSIDGSNPQIILLHVRQFEQPITENRGGSLRLKCAVPCGLLGGMSTGLQVEATISFKRTQLEIQWHHIRAIDLNRRTSETETPTAGAKQPWDSWNLASQEVEQLYPRRTPRIAAELALPLQWDGAKSKDKVHVRFGHIGSVLTSLDTRDTDSTDIEQREVISLISRRTLIPSDGDGNFWPLRLFGAAKRTTAPFGEGVSLRLPLFRELTAKARAELGTMQDRADDRALAKRHIDTGGSGDADARDLTIWSTDWTGRRGPGATDSSKIPVEALEYALMDADGHSETCYVIHGFDGTDVPRMWNEGVGSPYRKSLLLQQRGQPFSPIASFARPKSLSSSSVLWMARISGPNPSRLRYGWRVDRLQPVPEQVSADMLFSFPAVKGERAQTTYALGRIAGYQSERVITPTARSAEETLRIASAIARSKSRDDWHDVFEQSGAIARQTQRALFSHIYILNEHSSGQFSFFVDGLTPVVVGSTRKFRKTATASSPVLRLGSIAFTLATEKRGAGSIAQRSEFAASFESLRESFQLSTVRNVLVLPVDRAAPAAQDAPAGDIYTPSDAATATELELARNERIDRRFERETPIVIWLKDKSTEESRTDFWLRIVEQTRADRTRSLDMQFSSDRGAASTKPMRTLVLDSDPFMVALVEFDDFTPQRPDGTSLIAQWKSTPPYNSAWRIQGGRGTSRLLLPPQAVGESMIRGTSDSPAPDSLLDFRLGQTSTLTLERSSGRQRSADALTGEIQDISQDQNFTEVPWNLRRTLSDPDGDRQGAKLKSVQLELVYGLSCRVDAPALRLSELFSRVGGIPGRIPVRTEIRDSSEFEQTVHRDRREEWSKVFEQYRSRVALLEPWDADDPGSLVLNDGVRCVLRAADVEEFGKAPDTSTGMMPLQGGALRGVEVGRIYQAIRTDPRSTSATLADPYLSSLGGWGFQKASFDLNRSSVYAHVSLGRTQDYTVERIGRIGVLWNRAKHVIVYERTVLASDQFEQLNSAYDHRAVLRKVDEYVEILEVSRRYPENGGSPMMPGFVSGSHFPTPSKIRVDSAWGSDVGENGWQVPLWKVDADQRIYPKPEIALSLLCKTEGRVDETLGCISNPSNVYFYTSTERPAANDARDLGDSNQWAAEPDVDFAVLPWPKPCRTDVAQCAYDLPDAGDKPQAMAADDHAIPPGYERFTFVLEKPALQANIAAGRDGAATTQAIGAFVETVTMTRGAGRALPDDGIVAERKKMVADYGGAGEAIAPVMEVLRNLATEGQIAGGVIKGALQKNGVLDTALRQADEAVKCASARALAQLRIKVNGLEPGTAATDALNAVLKREADAFKERFTKGNSRSLVETFIGDLQSDFRQYTSSGGIDAFCRSLELATANRVAAFRLSLVSSGANPDRLLTLVRQNVECASDVVRRIERATDQYESTITRIDAALDGESIRAQAFAAVQQWKSVVTDIVARVVSDLRHLIPNVSDFSVAGVNVKVILPASPAIDRLNAEVSRIIDETAALITWSGINQPLDLAKAKEPAAVVKKTVQDILAQIIRTVGVLPSSPIDQIVSELQSSITTAIKSQCSGGAAKLDALIREATAVAETHFSAVATELSKTSNKYTAVWQKGASDSFKALAENAEDLNSAVLGEWIRADRALQDFSAKLRNQADDVRLQVKHLQEHLSGIERQARDIGRRTVDDIMGAGLTVEQRREIVKKAGPVLSLVRAFGNPPEVPQMTFNRKRIGYYYGPVPTVDITPVVAYAKDTGDNLNALGVRLPTRQLAERLIPDSLENFDFNKCFSSLAGMKLPKLFQGFKLPSVANDRVRITHGVDPKSRRGWLNAELQDITVNPGELFTLGPLTVRIPSARFRASSRMEAALDGTFTQRATGQVVGTFEIIVGGSPIVIIRDTTLSFNDGKVRFEVKPANVEMQSALKFISDVMKKFVGEDSGLTITFYPGGIESRIALPLPDTQSGTTGISGLSLHAYFALEYAPEFVIAAGISLATPEKPFALTVFVLGGGGYVDVSARYLPRTGDIRCRVRIAVNASASLAISLGPIKGGVYVYLGCEVAFEAGGGRKASLSFGVFLLIRGEVDLLGIVSVSLALHLSVTYNGEGLIARGRVTFKIKICAFFTLKVDQSVQYRLGCFTQDATSLTASGNAHAHQLAAAPAAAIDRRPAPSKDDCAKWAMKLVDLAA